MEHEGGVKGEEQEGGVKGEEQERSERERNKREE